MRGVYIIKNLKTGWVYIGSSNAIELRIEEHFEELNKGKHYNFHLNLAYKKEARYFVWGVVYQFGKDADRDLIYRYEQMLLDSYQKKYNIYINARDHLLEDKSKVQRTRQWRLKL